MKKKKVPIPASISVSDEARRSLQHQYDASSLHRPPLDLQNTDALVAAFKNLFPAEGGDIEGAIDDFQASIYAGEIPNPAVLCMLAERLSMYVRGKGEVSIQDVLGSSGRGVRDRLRKRETETRNFEYNFAIYKKVRPQADGKPGLKIESAAAEVKKELGIRISVQALKSGFIAVGGATSFDQMFENLRAIEAALSTTGRKKR